MRWLVLLPLFLPACRCAGEAEVPSEVPSEIAAPRAARSRSAWSLTPPEVRVVEGGLDVTVRILAPADAPERVWVGVSGVRPDGTAVHPPLLEVARGALGRDLSLAAEVGEGVTTWALGVWAEPPCEDCDRLARLDEALVAWPPRAEGTPALDKLERRVQIRFADVGTGGAVAKVVRQATATRLAFHYPGPTWSVATEDATDAGDPRDALLVRYRDPLDASAAEAVAVDLRKVVEGPGVVVEHAPDLPVPFLVDLGGDATVAAGAETSSGPTRMRRPGRP